MKTKLFLSFLLLGMTLSSCTEEIANNTYTRGKLSIEVMDANIPKTTTRTAYSDLVTTFEGGDKVGLYVVKGSGSGAEVVNDNVCYTYDSSTSRWTTSSDVEYNSDYHYYAYFPYRSDHGYTPAYTATGVDNIFNTFITDSSNKFHETDQSTKENFNKSDLMLAAGTATEAANTITFAMNHKKGLVKFTERGVIETWTGNIPYKPGNDYAYYLMKPSTSTSFTNNETTFTLAASSGKQITCNGKIPRTISFTSAPVNVVDVATTTITATPSAGGDEGSITYSVTPDSIATINPTTGVITWISEGVATVTATISEGTNYQAAINRHYISLKKNYVDLGLPSGVLWAKGNIDSDGNGGYKVGEETDCGLYFSWGNVVGHARGESYSFGGSVMNQPYISTPGYQIAFTSATAGRSYEANTTYDAARACLGDSWEVPTAAQFQELINNTDRESTTIMGISGRKFMKKSDHSVYVFFPVTGYWRNASIMTSTTGYYWSSSLGGKNFPYNLTGASVGMGQTRNVGMPIRAVRNP